ncbi:hypothetical protein SK128_019075 [Halocaridina rubra]|uniref:Uncharacterized protein n=1 Tax=Halocaridina rubra TaxID=373956 RepID=A0AAN8X273_HALRR
MKFVSIFNLQLTGHRGWVGNMRDFDSSGCQLETCHGLSYVDDDGDLERVVLQNTAPAVRQSVSVSRPIVRGPVVQKFSTAPVRPTVSFRASRPVATFGRQNIQTIFVRDTSDERF